MSPLSFNTSADSIKALKKTFIYYSFTYCHMKYLFLNNLNAICGIFSSSSAKLQKFFYYFLLLKHNVLLG